MNTPAQESAKKVYTSPVIHVYGDIKTLTQSFGANGALDGGGSAGFDKTAA